VYRWRNSIAKSIGTSPKQAIYFLRFWYLFSTISVSEPSGQRQRGSTEGGLPSSRVFGGHVGVAFADLAVNGSAACVSAA